jgi:hypothetical protein
MGVKRAGNWQAHAVALAVLGASALMDVVPSSPACTGVQAGAPVGALWRHVWGGQGGTQAPC